MRFARDLENIAPCDYAHPTTTQGGLKMLSNRHELFPLLSIRYTGSRFTRDLQNISPWDYARGLKMLSIRTNRHKSLPLLSIRYTGSRFAGDLENIASRVCAGWVENVVDSI